MCDIEAHLVDTKAHSSLISPGVGVTIKRSRNCICPVTVRGRGLDHFSNVHASSSSANTNSADQSV